MHVVSGALDRQPSYSIQGCVIFSKSELSRNVFDTEKNIFSTSLSVCVFAARCVGGAAGGPGSAHPGRPPSADVQCQAAAESTRRPSLPADLSGSAGTFPVALPWEVSFAMTSV